MNVEDAGREAAEEIRKEHLAILEKSGATFRKISNELCTIAFSDIRDYVSISEGGGIEAIPLSQMVRRKSRAIRKIKEHTQIKESTDGTSIFKDSRVEYELYDKMEALKYLCKLRGDEPNPKMELTGEGFRVTFETSKDEKSKKENDLPFEVSTR